ncbi:alpha/beta hydrolase [Dyadobacter sp. CY312]|uniref:alpha/beta hydrolase n=1 Tax=Dyadobacter sp. CY312 TaxID=2907303 RepID=UPI001F3144F1|nr:dienelactone hydrolase family protein [Dyadobacter sp. CY312]MCE7041459.1 dienelactone hydrolase family protein [Dyadobacter sp. CY312]
MYQHTKSVTTAGADLNTAKKAIIMLHGRGAAPRDIISLQRYLNLEGVAILAPEATNNSWYPYSFTAPVSQNQPALDSALEIIDGIVNDIEAAGISSENIYFAGFSQGACLTLEYTARHAKKYAGIIALTGGLVGQELIEANYTGDFAGTPVFISTGDPDPHVPVSRVNESIAIFEKLNAKVTSAIYPGRPHTISGEEIEIVNKEILG